MTIASERLPVLAPAEPGGEPVVLVAAPGGRDDDERLVDRAGGELERIPERVEVPRERAAVDAGDDEAGMGGGVRRGFGCGRRAEEYVRISGRNPWNVLNAAGHRCR